MTQDVVLQIPRIDDIPLPHLISVADIEGQSPAGVADGDVLAQAPAKLNLFLHITGQRQDGYHELQTVFRFIELVDRLAFRVLAGNDVILVSSFDAVPPQDNLIVRAARALQSATGCTQGCHIVLEKVIPAGAGLGGGSSDAATTLVVLNHLWDTRLTLQQLLSIGAGLGADVPVFIAGVACWAEGTGDVMQLIDLPQCHYVVVHPDIHVDTSAMFAAPELTRNCSTITIRDFLNGDVQNVFEPVVFERYPQVAGVAATMQAAVARMQSGNSKNLQSVDDQGGDNGLGRVAMTGSGSTLFVDCADRQIAENLLESLQAELAGQRLQAPVSLYTVTGVDRSPLYGNID